MIDGVFGRIKYGDNDLYILTKYRPELAGSPEKFFRILDKIKDPKKQADAVRWGVCNLFNAGRHDLVAPFVNALGKRTFNGRSLKDAAILRAFNSGAEGGNQDFVELYHEHPAITAGDYAGDCMHLGTEANQTKSFIFY